MVSNEKLVIELVGTYEVFPDTILNDILRGWEARARSARLQVDRLNADLVAAEEHLAALDRILTRRRELTHGG